eukprot:202079_1
MMSLRIAKFPLVFFVLLCTPGGVLLASDIPMPQDEPENTDLLNSPDGPSKLLDGYFRESYGIPVDLKLLLSYYAGLIPRQLPSVTVTFRRDKNAASDTIDVEMGDLLEEYPNLKKHAFDLVFGSPKQSDLRTVKDLALWKDKKDNLLDWHHEKYDDHRWAAKLYPKQDEYHVAELEDNSKVVTMTHRNHEVWLLDSLTLLVFSRKKWWAHAVAYAKVNIDPVPLASFDTKLTIEGDTKKLALDRSDQISPTFFPYIPEESEFKLYMVKRWPDINDKKSVMAFREWFPAEKVELKMIEERTRLSQNLKFDVTGLKFDPIADGDKITFVFEDEERSIIEFSESKCVIICSPPSVPPNSKLVETDVHSSGTSNAVGSTLTVTCDTGYKLDESTGFATTTCRSNGTYSDSKLQQCIPIPDYCLAPPNFQFQLNDGKVVESVPVGTTMTVQCQLGFKMEYMHLFSTTVTCFLRDMAHGRFGTVTSIKTFYPVGLRCSPTKTEELSG